MLAIRGTHVSPEAKDLADKLVTMMRETPPWLAWALIALVPAVCEETLFRGWVQSALVGGWPSRGRVLAGLLAQAACFAVFHLLPERMPQSFALGLVAGAIALATRSLLPAIVCHAAHKIGRKHRRDDHRGIAGVGKVIHGPAKDFAQAHARVQGSTKALELHAG